VFPAAIGRALIGVPTGHVVTDPDLIRNRLIKSHPRFTCDVSVEDSNVVGSQPLAASPIARREVWRVDLHQRGACRRDIRFLLTRRWSDPMAAGDMVRWFDDIRLQDVPEVGGQDRITRRVARTARRPGATCRPESRTSDDSERRGVTGDALDDD